MVSPRWRESLKDNFFFISTMTNAAQNQTPLFISQRVVEKSGKTPSTSTPTKSLHMHYINMVNNHDQLPAPEYQLSPRQTNATTNHHHCDEPTKTGNEIRPTARLSFQLWCPSEPAGGYRILPPDWLPSAARQRRIRTSKICVRFHHMMEARVPPLIT